MSLRYALLGFLTTGSSSGYQLAQEFSESLGWFWYASHSQIHPELRRLEEQGLAASQLSEEDGRNKRIFSITPLGRETLNQWLAAQDTEYPPVRDVERVRLMFLDQQPLVVIRRHLEVHRDHNARLVAVYTQQLREVRQGVLPRLVKRLASQPEASHEMVTGLKALALQGNVMRARNEVMWAEDALLWLEQSTPAIESEEVREI
jgi:PadR family transcriptional regulator AphA